MQFRSFLDFYLDQQDFMIYPIHGYYHISYYKSFLLSNFSNNNIYFITYFFLTQKTLPYFYYEGKLIIFPHKSKCIVYFDKTRNKIIPPR